MDNSQIKITNAIRQIKADDVVSIAVMARELVRSGIKLDEKSLNEKILQGLLDRAKVDDDASLRLLCKELLEQGYGPTLMRPMMEDNLIVINPIKINPTVQGQMPGKGWAFIWELDRNCDDFNWLIGAHVMVDGRIYRVQGIENMPSSPQIGERLTLLCSSVTIDDRSKG